MTHRADLQAALAAGGKLLGSFTTFGLGCTGTGSLPALCNALNPNGGSLVNRRASYRFAYGANTARRLKLAAFEVFSQSDTGGNETVPTAIYAADASGKPTGTPLVTGTMTIGPTPGFYRTYLNVTIPEGRFFVSVDHRGNKTTISNLTSGPGITSGSGYYFSGGNWNLSSTWAGTPSYRIYCEGGGGPAEPRMSGTGVPSIGDSYSVDISQGRANANAILATGASTTLWGSIPLPFSLAPFSAPGCSLLVDGILQIGTQLDTTGAGSLNLTLPNDKSLVGAKLHHQWYVIDAPANPLGIVVSGGATSTIGG